MVKEGDGQDDCANIGLRRLAEFGAGDCYYGPGGGGFLPHRPDGRALCPKPLLQSGSSAGYWTDFRHPAGRPPDGHQPPGLCGAAFRLRGKRGLHPPGLPSGPWGFPGGPGKAGAEKGAGTFPWRQGGAGEPLAGAAGLCPGDAGIPRFFGAAAQDGAV